MIYVVAPAAEGWKFLELKDSMIYLVAAASAGRSNTLFGSEERRESFKFEGS